MLWLGRDSGRGEFQYVVFNKKPKGHFSEHFVSGPRSIRVELRNEIGEKMAGRPLTVGQFIKISCKEVSE